MSLFGRRLVDALLPTRCLLCGAGARRIPNLCDGCLGDLPALPATACPRCASPAPAGAAGGPCRRCLVRPPVQSVTICAFAYAPPLDGLVSRLKFRGALAAAPPLAHALAAAVRRRGGQRRVTCLVPVPLHPGRLRERGFNQALEIARPLGRALGLPMAARGVRRIVATPAQTALSDADARRRNVAGVFVAGRLPPAVRHVAVVDDVVTTGATAGAVAAALRRAGARTVEVWAVARALPAAPDE